ncbi:MAG: septation protein A [Alphaproteobacteria bacterium]|uniref:septation protein A n=1 Tax=Rhizobium/Agrobacterium group TaxID=227290 RepID=UPI00083E55F2|nr:MULTISPECIES: septation protein A [unclassified Agrobacterium]MBU0738533.1 septation protein A [Alphaproteobacteria bacterium]AOG11691.1 intracellular septation protein A [Agrobacterium sp. RAC06]MBU0831413.1 septation protein A [Alphaproteobacteria bacterium]MBU1762359.1 septation protein A [Alphaproteobacteria bacterium]QGG92535.1 septation protein A [Agrobacterium sp. MA01]
MSDTSTDTHASKAEKQNPLLKMALELGPLLIFFFGNLRGEWLARTFPELTAIGGPLLIATALFMAATILSLIISKIVFKHLPVMPFVSGIVVLVFGGLSIWLQDDTFIKMKPTIVNTLFGVVLLGGLAFGTSLLGYVFNAAFQLDAEGWRKLTLRWGIFFLFLAVLNEVVWRNFSDDVWVSFKVWGTMPITILFTLAQMPLIMKHSLEEKEAE